MPPSSFFLIVILMLRNRCRLHRRNGLRMAHHCLHCSSFESDEDRSYTRAEPHSNATRSALESSARSCYEGLWELEDYSSHPDVVRSPPPFPLPFPSFPSHIHPCGDNNEICELTFVCSFCANIPYSYQQNVVNGATFTIRSRSLNSALYWVRPPLLPLTRSYSRSHPARPSNRRPLHRYSPRSPPTPSIRPC
jgi:hypothetical protein